MSRKTRVGALALAMLQPVACTVRLDVPPSARVTCTSDAECPSGWLCRPAIGRCVAPGADEEPPGIVAGSVAIGDAPLSYGTLGVVRFAVTESLFEVPVVELSTGGGRVPLVFRSQEELTYEFSYAPRRDRHGRERRRPRDPHRHAG